MKRRLLFTRYLTIAFIALFVLTGSRSIVLAASNLHASADGDVYWFGQDGNRYLFAGQDDALRSWSMENASIDPTSWDELARHPLAGIIRFRPGSKPARVESSDQLYAVARHGVLRAIEGQDVAQQIYPNLVDGTVPTIAIAQYTNYVQGEPVRQASDFDPQKEAASISTPDDNPALVVQFPGATSKVFRGSLSVHVERRQDGAWIAHASLTDANSPANSITIELVNESNVPIQTCSASYTCSQALVGTYAVGVHQVIAKATNELGQTIISAPSQALPNL